jgi:Zn-dependent oligopeptidase
VADTRKKMALARGSKPEGNLALVLKGIQYRKEIASLLGYDSWASYITETRMAGSHGARLFTMDSAV